jgi:hypothetical protein
MPAKLLAVADEVMTSAMSSYKKRGLQRNVWGSSMSIS